MRTDVRRWPRVAIAAAAVVGLGVGVAGTAVVVGLSDDEPSTTRQTFGGPIKLVAYDTCESALAELKAAALPHVGPYGLAGEQHLAVDLGGRADSGDGAAVAAEAQPDARGGAAAPAAPEPGGREQASKDGGGHSGTNVHESGVDEPDLVKTDGRRVVTVTNGVLTVVDVATRERTARVSLPGGYANQLLLDGDRALVLTPATEVLPTEPVPLPEPVPDRKPSPDRGVQGSQLVLVDLTGAGKVLGTLRVDGAYLDARQVGSVARVVVRSTPHLPFTYPMRDNDLEGARERNREIVENSSIADWMPRYALDNGGKRSEGQLVECSAVSHPERYTGTAMLTVLTVDLQGELTNGDPIGIAADGDTVYGTGTSLYVADDHFQHATSGFAPEERPMPEGSQRTEVYQFDISGQGKPVHVASGGVEGTLLNQYSLSEHEGNLRIATTVGVAPDSRSMVSVLTRRGNELAQVGRVDGLGKGERIYSVRYMGDVAYVVTFRQTDPLYTVDLSDPAAPKVTGELKITGYSAYLHPLGEDRLLGIGQEATTDGVSVGLQVSLFDTSAAGAERVGQFHFPNAFSEVESDPHAFLYWPEKDLVVLPVVGSITNVRGSDVEGSGMLVLRVSDDRIDEVGMIRHSDPRSDREAMSPPPRRALVIGEELWTVSDYDIVVSDLDTLTQQAHLPL